MEIYTDGGSRGNPGNSACAFVVYKDGVELYSESNFLGSNTNNFAEYSGVKTALLWLTQIAVTLANKNTVINFYSDSELMVKQLNGLYRIKNETLKILSNEIKKMIISNNLVVKFHHVLRERNERADQLVNLELDSQNF